MTKPPKTLHIALADNNQRLRCWTANPQEAHQLRADGVPMHTYDLRGPIPNDVTPAMVTAANEAYCPFGDMELAIRAALYAAPEQN